MGKWLMIFPKLELFDHFAIDTETLGLDWWLPKIKMYGFSISTPDGKDYYWDIRDEPKAIDWLKDSIKYYEGIISGHNMKFDTHFFRKEGVDLINNNLDCTSVRACLLDENRLTYNLDDVARDCVGIEKVNPYQILADMFGGKPTRKAQILNLSRPEAKRIVTDYAMGDTRAVLSLWEWQKDQIEKEDLHKIIGLERKVFKVVYDMEQRGVRVDTDRAEKSVIDLDGVIEKKREELDKLAGFPINPNPSGSIKKLFNPKQGKDGVWVAVDGTRLESTNAGNPSLNADALRLMNHPASDMILDVRKLMKCRDTFILGHVLGSQHKGRVYPNINQTKGEDGGTKTGRLSYTAPALQQIPSRDKLVKSLTRVLFLPEVGQKWYKMDYSQADARGFVHYVQSPPLVKAYNEDPRTDFHSLTSGLTGLPRSAPYSGGANCFDEETEYLSPTGWKKISEYDGGLVGQYHLNGTVDMVEPIQYIISESGIMYNVREGDMILTPNHRVLSSYKGWKNIWKQREDTVEYLSSLTPTKKLRVITSWIEERKGMPLSDVEIRLSVAFQADGSYDKSKKFSRFGLKLPRKIARLKELLEINGTKYSEHVDNRGITVIRFNTILQSKSFGDKVWYDASYEQRLIILEEICHWDGHFHKLGYKVYYNTDKPSADYVHWASSSIGLRTSMYSTNDEYRTSFNCKNPKKVWQVRCGLKKSYTIKPNQIKRVNKFHKVYCFTLPSSYMPVRRNGRVYISGQSKQMGLGLLFSMGEGTMAFKMMLPYTVEKRGNKEWLKPGPEAQEIFNNFHRHVPGVKEFSKRATSVAKTRGFIISLMGRHMRFPRGMFAYRAAGYLYQSATSEFNKTKMVTTHEMLKGTDSELLLSVHDELNFSSDDKKLMNDARIEMEDFSSEKAMIKLSVPMVVDPEVGENWYAVEKC